MDNEWLSKLPEDVRQLVARPCPGCGEPILRKANTCFPCAHPVLAILVTNGPPVWCLAGALLAATCAVWLGSWWAAAAAAGLFVVGAAGVLKVVRRHWDRLSRRL